MSVQSNLSSDNPDVQRGRRRPLLFVLLVLVLLFVITYASRLAEYRRLLGQEATMQTQVEDAEARGRQLTADLEYVKSPEYVEKIAITELGLAREGDQLLTVVDAPAVIEPEPARVAAADAVVDSEAVFAQEKPGTAADAESSVWRQWLSIFRSQRE